MENIKKVCIALFLCLFSALNLQGQSKIDSLEKVLKLSRKNDTITVNVLKELCRNYIDLDNVKLEQYAKSMLSISENIDYIKGKADALNFLGIVKDINSDYPKALQYYTAALVLAKQVNSTQTIASIANNIGLIEWKTGDLKKALASFFDALKQAQSLNKIKLQANISSNIGLVFQDLERRNEALSWQKKALNLRLKDNDKYGLASTYTNLASAYSYLKKVSLSIYHQKQAIALQKELGDEYGLGISYLNLGADYKIQKNYEEALKYYNLSQAIREKNDDKLGLSFTYMSIATIYSIQQKYKEAITYGEKSLAVATQIKSDDRIAKNSLGLSNIYNKAGNAKKALALLEQYNYHHDKVFNEEMNKKVSELQVKYETEEKEKDLTKAKLQLTQEELSSKQKSIWLIVLGAIVLLGFILFRNFRAKTKLKQEQLLLENKLLEEQTHAKIQEQRLEISRELHDSLGSQLTFISSILDGLKNSPTKLDQAVNNKINTLSDFSENSINELKNTIWALNAKELKLDDLKMKLLNFIKNAAEAKEDVNFNFDFDVANNFQLNSKQAINLFRVFQEIINNALKYAKAKNITASVKQNGNVLAIGIADDGIGFDMAEAEQKSYGIGNIKNRIAEINGKLNIDTAPNKGTNYQLEISLA